MKKIFILASLLSASLFAQSFSYTEYISVRSSQPVYTKEVVRTPYQDCQTVNVPEQICTQTTDPLGAITGAVVGGVLGHQLGRKHHRRGPTAVGAVMGGMVGAGAATRKNCYTEYRRQRECVTRYRETYEKVFNGYRNIGWYKGHKIVKMSNRPLKRIPLTITVSY